MVNDGIQEILSRYNIWDRAADEFMERIRSGNLTEFVPSEDSPFLQYLKENWKGLYENLRLDCLPVPFTGDISAPACLLGLSPGWSPMTKFDQFGLAPEEWQDQNAQSLMARIGDFFGKLSKNRSSVEEKKQYRVEEGKFKIEISNQWENEYAQKLFRTKLLIDNYHLMPETAPWYLDRAFDTAKVTKKGGGKTPKRVSAYQWATYMLSDCAPEKKDQLFFLNFFPYHTLRFNPMKWILFEKEHPEFRPAHSLLRDALIRQFAAEGRILVVRCSAIKDYMIQELQVPEKQICTFSSVQNPHFSQRNLKGDPETVQRLIEILGLGYKRRKLESGEGMDME